MDWRWINTKLKHTGFYIGIYMYSLKLILHNDDKRWHRSQTRHAAGMFFFFADLHHMKHNEQWVGSRRGIVSLQQQQDQQKGRGDNKEHYKSTIRHILLVTVTRTGSTQLQKWTKGGVWNQGSH